MSVELAAYRVMAALVSTPAPMPTTGAVDPSTGHGAEWGKAAPIGLLVIVLLVVVCYFLARSMSKNIRRVPASFDPDAAAASPAAASPDSPKTG